MKKLIRLIKEARFVFVCGNGGSAATAEHLTNDLFSRGIKAICLNSNSSIMTMIANDFGYECVFSAQLAVYANEDDLLITISCSGTSKNVVEAIETAHMVGMKIHNFETFKKNRPFGQSRDYEKLEDRHMRVVHKIKKAL